MKKIIIAVMSIAVLLGSLASTEVRAADQKTYKYYWSHYTGWEFYQYMVDSGIMKKWADKYGVKIDVVLINDYVPSINQYTAGEAVGCAMTIMDALDMPAVGGVDSDVLAVGDYSNGNDGVVLMNGKSMKDIKGRGVQIVQGSCSSYLLSQGLKLAGLKDSDVTEINTTDSSIGSTFQTSGPQGACVTWNPILMQVRNAPKATLVFDSSKIPGEIQDLMIVRRDAPEAVKKALVGAWYEAMTVASGQGKNTDDAIEAMAKFAGGTVAEFKAQLKTTYMYYKPADALAFASSKQNKDANRTVANFCYDHGLFGTTVKSADEIGIEFPDGTIQGNPKNVKIHYTGVYMKAAADGKL